LEALLFGKKTGLFETNKQELPANSRMNLVVTKDSITNQHKPYTNPIVEFDRIVLCNITMQIH
jgi:hypothetical protein